jgi:hypothetical protein
MLLIGAPALAVGLGLAGCSPSASQIPAKVAASNSGATVSGVHCAAQGHTVTVTGSVDGMSTSHAQIGVDATVYDSAGAKVGQTIGPSEHVHGKPVAFSLTVTTSANPARCLVNGATHFVVGKS